MPAAPRVKSMASGPGTFLLGLIVGLGPPAFAQDATQTPSPPTDFEAIPGLSPAETASPPGLRIPSPSPNRGFFGVARASIFGPSDYAPWRPLSLRTFFSEGWDEPWIAEPNDSGDAQQGWINAADGNFYRLYFFSYTFTNHLAQGGDGHTGAYTLYTPLSRRLELITVIPFVTSQPTFGVGKQAFPNPSTPSRGSASSTSAGFGDITLTPRVMLIDGEDFALNAQTSVQMPTGYRRTGAGQAIVTPGAQFWWNFAEGWVTRGGFNVGAGTNPRAGGTTLLSQLAIGKTLTPDDVPLFGDFTLYLSGNVFNDVSSSSTTVTLTPGFRTHLGKGWYALGGIDVPVTGPRPYEESAIFWLMKTF